MMWAMNTCHFILDYNSHISCWICTLFVPVEILMNTVKRSYKLYIFTLTVSPAYLVKLKHHKTTFWSAFDQTSAQVCSVHLFQFFL